jgi:hypothetical protein
VAQVVECLPSKQHKTMSSNSSAAKNKKFKSQVRWYTPEILARRRLRCKDGETESRPGYTVSLRLVWTA